MVERGSLPLVIPAQAGIYVPLRSGGTIGGPVLHLPPSLKGV